MSFRTILVVLLALLCGGSSVAVLRGLSGRTEAAPVEKTSVVVAALDVPRAGRLTKDHVKVYEYPKDVIPPGSLVNVEDALDRVALGSLVKGEIVLDGKLAPKGSRGPASLIPKGMRALTILTPSAAANTSGFVIPGNTVDVLLTTDGDPQSGGSVTTTLLQRLETWAVGQRLEV